MKHVYIMKHVSSHMFHLMKHVNPHHATKLMTKGGISNTTPNTAKKNNRITVFLLWAGLIACTRILLPRDAAASGTIHPHLFFSHSCHGRLDLSNVNNWGYLWTTFQVRQKGRYWPALDCACCASKLQPISTLPACWCCWAGDLAEASNWSMSPDVGDWH